MEREHTKLMLVSANVGSIFEDPEHMLKLWLKEFLKYARHVEPGMVAIHCQEVGGKNYEASMQHVNQFVKAMLGSEELQKYDRARVFLDEDYTAADKFTALGNLYFIHESVEDVMIWDFIECKFTQVEGREVLSGNIENIQIKEKAKFPQNFFPDFAWSRKGFLRTRWSVNNSVFDLVNIHLFHDASNIVAMQNSPSLYSVNRAQALRHTLQRFEDDQFENVPFFVFGDFNFRLDLYLLVKELTDKTTAHHTKGKKDQITKVVYTEEGNGKVVLTVESKAFDHHDQHKEVFTKMTKWLREFDTELKPFSDKLFEFDINFPPSYPFSEDVHDGMSYMKTRCPSWCDRILLSHSAKNIIYSDEKHQPKYHSIGQDVCMGDHKPVALEVLLKKGKGKISSVSSVDSQHSRPKLTKKLSINGEDMDMISLDDINIHDFAKFAKEQELLPEFRTSIKRKETSVKRELQSTSQSVLQKSSFSDIASRVVSMEKVLLRWPRRSRERHHSSSSEDFNEAFDSDDKADNDDNRCQDVDFVHKAESELSKTEPVCVTKSAEIKKYDDELDEKLTQDVNIRKRSVRSERVDTSVVHDCSEISNCEKQEKHVHDLGSASTSTAVSPDTVHKARKRGMKTKTFQDCPCSCVVM
ncbi:hypothetical protein ACJMK2_006569 [Sinanodonta woodiana]|uniref:inositol-polyphosphate 5-phosphatase n=1 Tax=Sinanodonta woodiana TaxID=1069815 RepID=A0ABD3VX12_SINWO